MILKTKKNTALHPFGAFVLLVGRREGHPRVAISKLEVKLL